MPFTIHNIHVHLVDWQHGGCHNIPSTWWWRVPADSTLTPLSRQVSSFPQQLTALCILQDLQREAIRAYSLAAENAKLLKCCYQNQITCLYAQCVHWARCEHTPTSRPLTKLPLQCRTQSPPTMQPFMCKDARRKMRYTSFLSGIVVTCAVWVRDQDRMQLVTQQGLNSKVETCDGSAESWWTARRWIHHPQIFYISLETF